MQPIELLSPARNTLTAIQAINCGADAVYIGATQFSARASAGNPLHDIETLVKYAHKYKARIYAAVNTIIFDNELEQARRLAHNLYNIGIDALIIQDMSFLEMDIPPIPLHASTQNNNRTLQKIIFLEKAGFKRAVLARELDLEAIKEIRAGTGIELECFVHGALCVSYSGQCYMSYARSPHSARSANRGECAQPCRLPYSLTDSKDKQIMSDKHLLCLKDLNLSDYLSELINTGVCSFKIEGRLKDINYVKNITAFYRKKIDDILNNESKFNKPSIGSPLFHFSPDPQKTFNRGYTEYFIHGRNSNISSFDTPKSLGMQIGKAESIGKDYFIFKSNTELHNNDGLCFLDLNKNLAGIKINNVNGNKIYPNNIKSLYEGAVLYRNSDQEFDKFLTREVIRKIDAVIEISESENGFFVKAKCEAGIEACTEIAAEKEIAKDKITANDNLIKNMSKSGESVFKITQVLIKYNESYFMPVSLINKIRRDILELLEQALLNDYKPVQITIEPNDYAYPEKKLDYRANVANTLGEQFYRRHGVEQIEYALETQDKINDSLVMTTKLCLQHEFGICIREKKIAKVDEPLFLTGDNVKYRIEFDCDKCEMNIYSCEQK